MIFLPLIELLSGRWSFYKVTWCNAEVDSDCRLDFVISINGVIDSGANLSGFPLNSLLTFEPFKAIKVVLISSKIRITWWLRVGLSNQYSEYYTPPLLKNELITWIATTTPLIEKNIFSTSPLKLYIMKGTAAIE